MSTSLTPNDAAAIADLAAQELSRRSLLDFAARVFPGWQNAPHLTLIADLLEKIDSGELKRLIVNLPPRHGKTLCVRRSSPRSTWAGIRDGT